MKHKLMVLVKELIIKLIDVTRLKMLLEKWIPAEKMLKYDGNSDIQPKFEFEIQGLDIQKGVDITGGDIQSYINILSVFRNDLENKLIELRNNLTSVNLPLFTTNIHALKSASASMGATEISHLANCLEDAGNKNDIHFITANINSIYSKTAELINQIDLFFSKSIDEKNTIDIGQLRELLPQLKHALSTYNVSYVDNTMNEIAKTYDNSEIGFMVNDIKQKILLSDYENAEKAVDQLLESL